MRWASVALLVTACGQPEAFVRDSTACIGDGRTGDDDDDGVCNDADACPGTPADREVDLTGCGSAIDDTDPTTDTSDSGLPSNRPPSVPAPQITPDPPYNDSEVSCAASATDPDGTTPVVTYQWVNTTRSQPLGGLPTITLDRATAAPGDVLWCTATASDGVLTTARTAETTVADRPPEVDTPVVSPPRPRNTQAVTCAATATDPDGQDPVVTYAWRNVTAAVDLGTGAEILLTPATAAPGDTLRCTATATAGSGSGSESAVATVNAAPTIGPPTITPDPLFNDALATCTASASDPGDPNLAVTYTWRNVGQSRTLGTGPTLQLDFDAARPTNTIACDAVASDGVLSASSTATRVVSNRAPVVPTPILDRSAAFVDSRLACSADVADPDDPDGLVLDVSTAWTNDTTGADLGTRPELQLSPSFVSVGDVVRCTVTAEDPTAPPVSAFAELPVQADPLACVDPPVAGCRLATDHIGTAVYVEAGAFEMGCKIGRDDVGAGCAADELPLHTVTFTRDLWVMESELTQDRWTALGFFNGSWNGGLDTRPKEYGTWWEALHAANEASARDGLATCYTISGCDSKNVGTGRVCTGAAVTAPSGDPADCTGWRLPTEAEWEYFARAGTGFAYAGGDDADQVAWHDGTDATRPQAFCDAPTPRNAFGLCDLSGNVWEFVWDAYSAYAAGPATNPVVNGGFAQRVARGGSHRDDPSAARNAARRAQSPNSRSPDVGFRLVRTADAP